MHFKTALQIKLGASAKVGGQVVDAEGKAISGASVAFLSAQNGNKRETEMLIEGPLLPMMTAHSDEKGAFELDGVPSGAQVYLSVSAPGRVSKRAQILAGGTGQIILLPGAQIQGRVFGLDGKPLAGMVVDAQSSNNLNATGGEATTGADGRFVLDGLSGGAFNVMFQNDPDAPFVVPALEGVKASVGTPKTLPDLRAVEGVLIGGHVLEAATKAPVEGIQIGVYGGLNPASSAQVSAAFTDKNGAWKMRTLAGQSKVYVMGGKQEFLRSDTQHNLEIGAAGNMNLDFTLKSAPKISGRLLDETGRGVKATITLLRTENREGFSAQSDDNGDFVAYGPTAGEWKVSTSGLWEIAGAERVQIQDGTPLEVRLKHANLAIFEIGVYDDNDNAVEGAHVTFNLTTGEGDGQMMQQREVISDKEGRAHIDDLRADQKVELQSVKKDGYDAAPLPKPDRAGKVWSASLVLIKRSGRAKGEVFDANGALATKALVSGSGVDTHTDDAGRFELAPLPQGITEVFAWHKDTFALASSDQTKLELHLQTLEAPNETKARAILDALAEQTKGSDYYARDALQLQIGSFEELAPKLGQVKGWRGIDSLVAHFGNDDSIPAARWFAVLQGEDDAGKRLYDASKWIVSRRTIAPDDEARAFLKGLQRDVAEIEPKFKDDDKWQFEDGIFGAAAFAERIGDTQAADDLFERARQFTLKAYGTESDRSFGSNGEFAVSPRLLQKTLALLPVDNFWRASLLGQAAPQLARIAGLDAAKPFLDELQTLKPKANAEGNDMSVDYTWHRAVVQSVGAGGKSNPQLALELAQSLPRNANYGGYDARDRALCEAARFQTPEIAHRLWLESLPRIQPQDAMRFLARMKPGDELFARDFYETLAADFDARPLDPSHAFSRDTPDIPTFAFYEARFNPARARFRLERGFAHAQSKPQLYGGDTLAPYAKAMALFDAARAVGWSAKSTSPINDPSGNFETRRRIAQWLALDEKARQKAGFSGLYSQEWDFAAR